jgi:outer membrane lipoprotein SlyB
MRIRRTLIGIAALAGLAGCEQPGANIQANVYRAGQVNQRQEAKVVDVLAVLPAKIEVGNEQARATAQIFGGLIGGIGGALIGNSVGGYHHTANTFLGGAAGGATGALAGSLVPDRVLVDGVSLTYMDNGRTLNSAQVGRMCEFKRGQAIVIATGPGETRIQPNDICPAAQGTKT